MAPAGRRAGTVLDTIVIGAGSAGCVVASRRARAGRRVLLLEAGRLDGRQLETSLPVGYYKSVGNPRFDWCYKSDAIAGLNGRALDWPRGKVVGGSGAINGLLWVRGNAIDYDGWSAAVGAEHAAHWGASAAALRFTTLEAEMEIGAPRCGTLEREATARAFVAAARDVGVANAGDDDAAAPMGLDLLDQEGADMAAVAVTARGLRSTSATSFLHPELGRHGTQLALETGVDVERLLFREKRCVGVAYIDATTGERREARLKQGGGGEVILAAGAIGSPHLLLKSGVGPPAQLAAHGIDLVAASPGVGEGLQDHLQIKASVRSLVPTLNDRVNSLSGLLGMGRDFALRRRGPLTMAPTPAIAFIRSTAAAATPDLQLHFGPWSAASREVKSGRLFRTLDAHSAFALTACQLRPTSRGSVRLSGANGDGAPAIQPNFLATAEDRCAAIRAVRAIRTFLDAPAFARVLDRESSTAAQQSAVLHLDPADDAAALEYARANASSIYHSAGTCRMGGGSAAAGDVVDGALRVNGVDALRVADASIMPTIVAGNTNAATLLIAETAAALVLQGKEEGGVLST